MEAFAKKKEKAKTRGSAQIVRENNETLVFYRSKFGPLKLLLLKVQNLRLFSDGWVVHNALNKMYHILIALFTDVIVGCDHHPGWSYL